MAFQLTIIGSNSAIPCHGRFPSAQGLQTEKELFLIDCGEGSQVRMEEFGIRKFKIDRIFISHLHGDHVYGLPGLLTTSSLLGREKPLYIYGPPGVESFIQGIFSHTGVELSFETAFIEVEALEKRKIYENEDLVVFAFPLDHRVITNGYYFQEKERLRHLDGKKAEALDIPFEWRSRLKKGEDYVDGDGRVIVKAEDITFPADRAASYAYCSDTRYQPDIADFIRGVDVLYHEATFLDEMKEKAHDRFHSTAREAAQIAKKAGVNQLLLGHISSRYDQFEPLVNEAREIFQNSFPAEEGQVFVSPAPH
ncbi:MAG: ribonuclease Z [Saprospiraceae bacterium]|nr:ribonuclease Z [Saprospiraceae bacterium]